MTERLIEKLDRLGAEAGIKKMTPEIRQFSWLVSQDMLKHWDARDKTRVLQIIKELRPAIAPLDGLGKGKTTHEWFDILVKEIEEKL
jgi:hypothetical protein